jgi:hypothetical protein
LLLLLLLDTLLQLLRAPKHLLLLPGHTCTWAAYEASCPAIR